LQLLLDGVAQVIGGNQPPDYDECYLDDDMRRAIAEHEKWEEWAKSVEKRLLRAAVAKKKIS
jgi:hypothetical protein